MGSNPAGWMASGGAFVVMFTQTAIIGAFSIWNAFRIGKAISAESDGCLLAMGNLVATLLGMGIGYFCAPYPTYVLTALAGSATLPTFLTLIFIRRYKHH